MLFMNIFDFQLMKYIFINKFSTQRQAGENLNFSIGIVNKSLQLLKSENYICDDNSISDKGYDLMQSSKPKNAIILAAGYGLRMIPVNMENPKALLTVDGVPLIERQIAQLHEAGIEEIFIVTGFQKEKFEYLIDKYNVKLVYNKDYASKNNLHSLNCVREKIGNSYIIPCDLWCSKNPYSSIELYSWYMLNELIDENSIVRVNRQLEINIIKKKQNGNSMVGISFIAEKDAAILKQNIKTLCENQKNDCEFWEKALFGFDNITVYANVVRSSSVVEINSYEQLRELDSDSKALEAESINVICDVFKCKNEDIHDIKTLKKGMTNRSFIFSVKKEKYIMRIPGEGTDKLINRSQGADVYNSIKGLGICDELFYINPNNGFKITRYINNARVCDPYNKDDLEKCMAKLRNFHKLKLKVNHKFDIFEQIDFYEKLWNGRPSVFKDYEQTKKNIFSLIPFINQHKAEEVLTHIDAVPDNFLFSTERDGIENGGTENIQLIDWEYAGMQDPHVDIAMFCIYPLYDDRKYIDFLIDSYFEGKCTPENRIKIYCYVASCGLLWSNWCEFKNQLGVEFGEYFLMQYRYAKEYYKIAKEEMKNMGLEQ